MRMKKTAIYLVIGICLFIFLSWYFSNIFIYLALALIISTILRPLTNYISQVQIFQYKVPRVLAVIVSFLVFLIIIGSFILLFIPLVSEQIAVIRGADYDELFDNFSQPLSGAEGFLIENNLTQEEPGFIVDKVRENLFALYDDIEIQQIINNLISITGNFFVGATAVFFISFFLLYEKGLFRRNLIALIPNKYFEVSIAALYKMEKLLSNYLLGLLFQMFAIFSIASLGLSIFRIKYALTIAVFAALANLIPYAGPLLGASFGILVGVSTMSNLVNTQDYIFLIFKIVSVFGIVQVIDNIVLQPLIFSKSVKAHPLEIFIIIFAGATLAGIPGMIAAIPVYTILRVSAVELYAGYKQYHIFRY